MSNSDIPEFSIRIVSKHNVVPSGTTQLRCIQPSEYLHSVGYKVEVNKLYRSIPRYNEIEIIHRAILDQYTSDFISYAKLLGNPVIYDTDDLIFTAEGLNYLKKIGKNYTVSPEQLSTVMKKCDAVVVSTTFLAEKVRAFHPNVYLLRNALSKAYLKMAATIAEQKNENYKSYLTVAYLSGSKSHNEDFKIVQPTLLKILENYKKCKVLLVGDLEFSVDFNKFGSQFEYKERTTYEKYASIFRDIDINIIPLELNEPFCHGKSELKYIEAGACAVPSIASSTTTYAEVINDGMNGLLVKNNDNWYECIESLIVDAEKRKSIGIKAREHVLKEYTPEYRKAEWADFMNKIWLEKTVGERNKKYFKKFKLRKKLEVARALRVSRIYASKIYKFKFV